MVEVRSSSTDDASIGAQPAIGTLVKNRILALILLCAAPLAASAQDTPRVPDIAEPQGFLTEPSAITRAALFADRHFGKGDLNNGFYVDFGKMIPGAGWLSGGPGYRKWMGRDTMLLDASAGSSVNGYKSAQAHM